MNTHTLVIILFLGCSAAFFIPGVGGFITGELKVSGKYYSTTYTGAKAIVMGFGYVVAGLVGLVLTFIYATRPTPLTSPILITGGAIAFGVAAACWVVSWFVPGEANKERRGLRFF